MMQSIKPLCKGRICGVCAKDGSSIEQMKMCEIGIFGDLLLSCKDKNQIASILNNFNIKRVYF